MVRFVTKKFKIDLTSRNALGILESAAAKIAITSIIIKSIILRLLFVRGIEIAMC